MSGRAERIVEIHVELMNCPSPDADELGLVALGLPPLSTPMIESMRPKVWFLLQSLIVFAVVASNIHWGWTPNPYIPALLGAGLAYGATQLLTEYRLRREKAGK
jgi:hypothetical protein